MFEKGKRPLEEAGSGFRSRERRATLALVGELSTFGAGGRKNFTEWLARGPGGQVR